MEGISATQRIRRSGTLKLLRPARNYTPLRVPAAMDRMAAEDADPIWCSAPYGTRSATRVFSTPSRTDYPGLTCPRQNLTTTRRGSSWRSFTPSVGPPARMTYLEIPRLGSRFSGATRLVVRIATQFAD